MLSSAVLPIVVFVVQAIFRSSGAVSTGSRADNPWLWVSDEQELVPRNKGDGLLEVVEIIDDPNAVNYKSQPRFIGHLKRKLCRVGVGVGCPGGRDRTRYTIEPQEINYVQPLMIQAVGKPIPAVPAVPTKRKDRRDKKRPKNEQKKLEKIQSDRETKSSAVPVTTKPINPLLSNALLSSQLNLLGSQSDFSNPFTNTGLGLSSSNFMAQPPKGPPPAVYKDSQTQMLSPGNVPQNPYSNFNSLSQTIRDHALAKTPLTMESFLASQSLDLNPASNGHIIRTADPGLFKANLINSLTSIPGFSSATDIGKTRTTSNFGVFQNTQNPSQLSLNSPNQVQTNRLISNQNSFIAPLRPNSNPINNNFLQNGITSDPNLLNVRTNHNPPQKIKVLNLSTRPKKEAIVSNESVEEKAKVIKHIHVHKHIHQMDEDTPTNVAQKVHDNLDSFSTSVFSTTDPAYNTRTKLQSDFRGSHRSKKRHRNLDSTPIANSVRSNIGSCTCVLKQECPSDLVSDFDINAKDDFRVTQDTRRNRQNFAASHSSSITSLDSRVMPENKTFPVSLQQIIKPRKNNMIPNNQFQVGNEERKIVLNLKRVTKRDIYSDSRNTKGKQKPVDSDVVDSAYMRKPKETYDSKLAHLASKAKNLNLKTNHKRDLTELLNNDLEFNTFSARQNKSPLCDEAEVPVALSRVKRSPQFFSVQDSTERNDNGAQNEPLSTRLFGSGLDGLLNPHISPSVGVHFGGYPYGHGYHGGGYHGGGNRSPFRFDLGPFSINPFGGLRFSLHNGRPHIRPTLDLLVTPNQDDYNDYRPQPPYNPYYPYRNRQVRAAPSVKKLSPVLSQHSPPSPVFREHSHPVHVSHSKVSRFQPSTPFFKKPILASGKSQHQSKRKHSPVNTPISLLESRTLVPSTKQGIEISTLPDLGKSLQESVKRTRDDRESIYRKVIQNEETSVHEAAKPRFIKTIGKLLSSLPLEFSFGAPKYSPASSLPFPFLTPPRNPIHTSDQQLAGTHQNLVSTLHPISNNPFPSLLQNAAQNLNQPLNRISHPISSILPPGQFSLYLDLLPEFLKSGSTKHKRRPITNDSHDDKPTPNGSPTQFHSNGRPSGLAINACSFVRCRDLSSYCQARIKPHRRSQQPRKRLQLDDLPFSCGLHEVCCNIDNFGTSFNDIGVTIPPSSESRTCGRSTVTTIKGRISSGSRHSGEAKFGEFPWQAAILKKEGRDSVYVCAGSLIDKSHILTAAHCVEGYDADHLRIRLGEWDVNRDTEFYAHLEYDVVGVAVHPDFYSGNLINDVALLRMLYPVDINNTPHVSPICLPSSRVSFAGSRCWVSGWGKNAFGKNGKYQNLLKKIDIPVLPRTACENILRETRLGPDYSLHPGMMCAGGEPEKDACKGDGGGPLSCRDVDGSFVLSGIVSWGIGCGQPGIPGVYVNVEYYVAWIRKMLKS